MSKKMTKSGCQVFQHFHNVGKTINAVGTQGLNLGLVGEKPYGLRCIIKFLRIILIGKIEENGGKYGKAGSELP